MSASASLTVSDQIHLDVDSDFFKGGDLFLWNDTSGNLGLGENALASTTGDATGNTAVGRNALRDTVGGASPYDSSYNTAVGSLALPSNTTGSYNTAIGAEALNSNTTGGGNTAIGTYALHATTDTFGNTAVGFIALFSNTSFGNSAVGSGALAFSTTGGNNSALGANALGSNTTGNNNTALGDDALESNTTGSSNIALGAASGEELGEGVTSPATTMSDNIFIGHAGMPDEEKTIRIGTADSSGRLGPHTRSFMAGIHGVTTGVGDAVPVVIDSSGQLGTASSSRKLKQEIRDVGELSDRLLDLRPVAFRYTKHAETDPDTPLQFGLIAEEVAEVFPELVVFDEEGLPWTVRYRLLSTLLLNELQQQEDEMRRQEDALRQQRQLDEVQRRELAELRQRLRALERAVR